MDDDAPPAPPNSNEETGEPSAQRNRRGSGSDGGAPHYSIPPRHLAAVEVPAVVKNVDRLVQTFGRVPTLEHTLDPSRASIPFYINPDSPFCKPIMSHNARSNNVVLKVTVPKRTGRKRKRGSDEPWQGDVELLDLNHQRAPVCSVARLDDPKILRRKLEDNVDKYQVEAVGTIRHTHRFRGLADFYWNMGQSNFAQRYVDQVLPGQVERLKEFNFMPGTDRGPNVEVLPPPIFTHMSLPFVYNYSQNPYVRTTEDGDVVNLTAVKQVGYFIGAEDPAPEGPQREPDMMNAEVVEIMAQLDQAFDDRPIWTRRALLNHLAGKLRNWNELKKYLNFSAYQFKGGPWRDAVVRYGVDPRTDAKYRIFQTLMFKLPRQKRADEGQSWRSLRRVQMGPVREYVEELSNSHIFDGETYHADGKVWQVCDVTDPLLKDLLDNASTRPKWDGTSGWYHGGLWAKVKAIMKTKLVALQFDRVLTRADFFTTLQVGDRTPVRSGQSNFHIPLPDLKLTDEQIIRLRGRIPSRKNKNKPYSVSLKDRAKSPAQAAGSRVRPEAEGGLDAGAEELIQDDDAGGSVGNGLDYGDSGSDHDDEEDDGTDGDEMDENGFDDGGTDDNDGDDEHGAMVRDELIDPALTMAMDDGGGN